MRRSDASGRARDAAIIVHEGVAKTTLPRVLADVDEAARAGQLRAEVAQIEVTLGVCFGQPEHRQFEPAAIVEIELVRLVGACGVVLFIADKVESVGKLVEKSKAIGVPEWLVLPLLGALILLGVFHYLVQALSQRSKLLEPEWITRNFPPAKSRLWRSSNVAVRAAPGWDLQRCSQWARLPRLRNATRPPSSSLWHCHVLFMHRSARV